MLICSGPPRRPPQATIDHLKMLNKTLGLDYMFCKSRNPDFLLDIIHSQVFIVIPVSLLNLNFMSYKCYLMEMITPRGLQFERLSLERKLFLKRGCTLKLTLQEKEVVFEKKVVPEKETGYKDNYVSCFFISILLECCRTFSFV